MSNADHLQNAYKFRKLIVDNPERKMNLLLQMADSYLKARSYTNATLVLRTVLKLEPLNVQAMLRLAKSTLGEKKYQTAIKLFETITELVPELEEGFLGLWAAHKAAKEYDKAIKPLDLLLQRNPGNEKFLLKLIKTCESSGAKTEKISYLRQLVAVDSKRYIERSYELAELLVEAGDVSTSLKYLGLYLNENENDSRALLAAAKGAAKIKKWESCAEYATKIIEKTSFSPEGMYILGVCRIEQSRFDEAILLLEQLVEKCPEPVQYRLALARASFNAGELSTAKTEYSRCLARHPEREDIVLRLAEISWKLGERENASRLYERTLQYNPAMALALFRLAYIKFDKGLYPSAISLFRRLLVVKPDNYKANLYLGRSLRLTGSFDKAVDYLVRSLHLLPGQARAEFELGLIYKYLRKDHLAKEHFNNAIKNDEGGAVGKDASYELYHLENRKEQFEQTQSLPLAVNGFNSPEIFMGSDRRDNLHNAQNYSQKSIGNNSQSKVKWLKLT